MTPIPRWWRGGLSGSTCLDFLKQLASFRIQGDTTRNKVAGAGRFGALFLAKLWDVYAQPVLTWSPF